jgi:glycosyltransferase involved in cell wall biosynthesis
MSGGLTVLMTADAVGGVWHYALGLCTALPECRFVLAVMGPPPDPVQRAAAERLFNIVIEAEPYRLEWMQGAGEDLAASRAWLSRLARLHGADLLHVNGYAHAAIDADLPVVVVAHSDVLSWWQAVHGGPAPAEWDPYRRAAAAGLAAADRIVAPTAAALDDLRRHYRFGRAPASVIPNGIDLARFAPREKRPVLMAAGRLWDRAKNLGVVQEIAGRLAWPVEIAGETTHPEGGGTPTLPSPASGAGRGSIGEDSGRGSARLLGPLSHGEMAVRLGEASIFAAPALYEPFGLAVAEAAAAGCAPVLADIPSLRENWEGAALFVPPQDRAAWRSTLACLIACDERRRALAAAARERAQRFSVQATARRYAALYRDLLHGNRAVA